MNIVVQHRRRTLRRGSRGRLPYLIDIAVVCADLQEAPGVPEFHTVDRIGNGSRVVRLFKQECAEMKRSSLVQSASVCSVFAVAAFVSGCGKVSIQTPLEEAANTAKPAASSEQETQFLALVEGFSNKMEASGFSKNESAAYESAATEQYEKGGSSSETALFGFMLDEKAASGKRFQETAEKMSSITSKVLKEIPLSAESKERVQNYPSMLLDTVVEQAAKSPGLVTGERVGEMLVSFPSSILKDAKGIITEANLASVAGNLSGRAMEKLGEVAKSESLTKRIADFSENMLRTSKEVSSESVAESVMASTVKGMMDKAVDIAKKNGSGMEDSILGSAAEGMMKGSLDQSESEEKRDKRMDAVMGAIVAASDRAASVLPAAANSEGALLKPEERFMKSALAGAAQAIVKMPQPAKAENTSARPEEMLQKMSQKAAEQIMASAANSADSQRMTALLSVASQGVTEAAAGSKNVTEAVRENMLKRAEAGALIALAKPSAAATMSPEKFAELRAAVGTGVQAAIASKGAFTPEQLDKLTTERTEYAQSQVQKAVPSFNTQNIAVPPPLPADYKQGDIAYSKDTLSSAVAVAAAAGPMVAPPVQPNDVQLTSASAPVGPASAPVGSAEVPSTGSSPSGGGAQASVPELPSGAANDFRIWRADLLQCVTFVKAAGKPAFTPNEVYALKGPALHLGGIRDAPPAPVGVSASCSLGMATFPAPGLSSTTPQTRSYYGRIACEKFMADGRGKIVMVRYSESQSEVLQCEAGFAPVSTMAAGN